jgi:hypothetical protein
VVGDVPACWNDSETAAGAPRDCDEPRYLATEANIKWYGSAGSTTEVAKTGPDAGSINAHRAGLPAAIAHCAKAALRAAGELASLILGLEKARVLPILNG